MYVQTPGILISHQHHFRVAVSLMQINTLTQVDLFNFLAVKII